MTALLIFAILFLLVLVFQVALVMVDEYTNVYVAETLLSVNRFFMNFYGLMMAILIVVKFLEELN